MRPDYRQHRWHKGYRIKQCAKAKSHRLILAVSARKSPDIADGANRLILNRRQELAPVSLRRLGCQIVLLDHFRTVACVLPRKTQRSASQAGRYFW